ncbi:MAG TPA: tetratricopeptide repeat protein [Rhizomicrobium sp.]|nr:tetratricopeptide repeat protein [Rhizomicrobium sp.]
MKRTNFWGLGWLLCAALSGGAAASSYSDFNAGISARNNHDYDTAIRYLSLALAAPDLPAHLKPTALFDRGEAYVFTKQSDAALADYDAGLALVPDSYDALQDRAFLHLQRKEFDLARADYKSAIAVRPELANGYVGHGTVNLAERRYDDAVKDYTDALGATLGALDLYVLRGDAYRMAGRTDEAIKDYDIAIRQDSKYADAYIARGRAYQQAGAFRDALSDFDEAARLTPRDADLKRLIGIAQWELGRFRDAEESFAASGGSAEQSAYAFLWRFLARPDAPERELAQRAAALDQAAWPGPAVRLVLGRAKPEDVLAAAGDGDADLKEARTCEADFFVGEWQKLRGDKAEGQRLFGATVEACRNEWPEWRAAKTELQRAAR